MLLEWYLMLLLLVFTVAAPPQFMRPPDYDSGYDDVETEEVIEVMAIPPAVGGLDEEHQMEIVLHRAGRQVPKCYWDGTAPFCAGQCPEGWKAVAYDSTGDGAACWTGMKAFCCPDTSYNFANSGILDTMNSFVTR